MQESEEISDKDGNISVDQGGGKSHTQCRLVAIWFNFCFEYQYPDYKVAGGGITFSTHE